MRCEMKKRKIPMRKCVVSQEMKPKKELFRIVRTPEGDVCFDPTGKKSGRGTYLSKDEAIIEKAKCELIYLPSYSPDLNPIEHYWASVKHHIRKRLPQYNNDLYKTSQYVFQNVLN